MKYTYNILLAFVLAPITGIGQLTTKSLDEHVTHLSYEGTTVTTTLIKNGNEAILVDTMFDTLALAVRQYIAKEGLVLKYIINTHYHGDHTGGNSYFKEVPKIAHRNTMMLIDTKAPYGPPDTFGVNDRPGMLFKDHLSLYIGDLQVDVVYLGAGHTTGDAIVFVPKSNVVIMGDVMLDAELTLPFFPAPEDGLAVLEQLLKKIDSTTQVVTGHGSIASRDNIVDLVSILKSTISYSKAGNDPDQFPEEWKSWDSEFMTMSGWLKMLDRIYE